MNHCSLTRSSTFSWAITAVLCMGLLASVPSLHADASDTAKTIIAEADIPGGLIVHLGSGDGKLTAALRLGDRFIVHGLDTDAAKVDAARKFIRSLKTYGPVSVDRYDGKQLPYGPNMVNLIVALEPTMVSEKEMLRVLAPNGVAYLKKDGKTQKIIKPRPKNIDDWTHYMHDASGNAVAQDTVVGPPRHLQWVGSPRWSRHHDRMASMSALVSASGRMFYIMDEGSRISIQTPAKWTVVARDAFNGIVLWKVPITKWHNHLWPLKSGPTQLARRLVATADRVYVTLSIDGPLTALDARTGKLLQTYENSASTEEIIESNGRVFVMVNKVDTAHGDFAPVHNLGDQRRVANDFRWNKKPRVLMGFDGKTGKQLWSKDAKIVPLTMSADAKRVFYHDGEKVVCLDQQTGNEVWASAPAVHRTNMTFNFGPKLVIYEDIVLYAGGDRSMHAYKADDGKELWKAPHARGGYLSPEDLLVVKGLVWSAPLTSGKDSGVFTGRDVRTGEIKREFPPDVDTYWFHHRCYTAKATTEFLMPSRTGIEFVDTDKKSWNINHWVRGGCLYGVMPCNGLVYAPPHNCGCYPEAKLFGFNALAPASPGRIPPKEISDVGRLEKGPAYGKETAGSAGQFDWPTYRHDRTRSGFTSAPVSAKLESDWGTEIGGKLSAITVAEGKLFVSQIEQHTLHALDEKTGKPAWSYTVGGRVDSPPTIHKGMALFGCADGWVYCLRASDGQLIWRFRAAPRDERLMSYEQLESVWPVQGSVLVQDDAAFFVCGRSMFLDGGLRYFKLEAATGKVLFERVLDETDPKTGKNLQSTLQVLNMPVGLPDILTSDGKYVYMRSQPFDADGYRTEIGPHSGSPAAQGAVQRGDTAHVFSSTGFMDDSYFHRAYWVYGRSFAGGHGGYYQAGKYAPSGRMMVFDFKNVYGFGRKPQYYKWTTTMEHQLFSAPKLAPAVSQGAGAKGQAKGGARAATMIQFQNTKSLDPTGKALAIEAWIKSDRAEGVILARGGPAEGYALVIRKGRPHFMIRAKDKLYTVSGSKRVMDQWFHVAGVLKADKTMQLYVNGKLVKSGTGDLIASDPAQAMEIGADNITAVGQYKSPLGFTGAIDEVRVYFGSVTGEEIAKHHADPTSTEVKDAKLVVHYNFDKGSVKDLSGLKNDGKVLGASATKGKAGQALKFNGRKKTGGGNRGGGYHVKHDWTKDVPLLVQAMVLSEQTLFMAGPPDLIDEEETFASIVAREKAVQAKLADQDAAFAGKKGAVLYVSSITDGQKLASYKLDALPVWDGMAIANGRLFVATRDGRVVSFKGAGK